MNNNTSFYILYSKTLNKYYSGITTDDMHSRISKHNASFHGRHFTSAAKDWEIRLVIKCESYSIARKTELYVKKMKSRKFIEKIISNENERNRMIDMILNTRLCLPINQENGKPTRNEKSSGVNLVFIK